MKKFVLVRNWVVGIMAAVSVFGLQSCLDTDDHFQDVRPNALVTVKPVDDGSFYLQLDEKTTLLPINLSTSPYGSKEVRALANCEVVDKPSSPYTKAVMVHWMDSILTKPMAQNLGAPQNDSIYGSDPVEIVNDWVTIAEDGYLTLRFSSARGYHKVPHFVNLISTNNPENPYEVEFRHNAYGDLTGTFADGLVAFKLDQLPDTQGETVKLKLKWKSYDGERSAVFNYCTRQSTPVSASMVANTGELSIK